ncbi:helix-turn-helix domain-containing protein [Salmonella enterica]|nr:helix-turn-helix domain-containing protein [Salmonella enterica]
MDAKLKEKIMREGSQQMIAKRLGCRQQTISLWLTKGVPDGKVLLFSEALGWAVTPNEIRPDLYPGAFDGLPTAMRPPTPQKPSTQEQA